LGVRAGNWLTLEQSQSLLEKSDGDSLRNSRDLAMISTLLGCGLRRAELSSLQKEDIQIRQGHWAIVDLVGKGGHIRTVPMPIWVKSAVDRWCWPPMLQKDVYSGLSVDTDQPGAAG
jgi:site-specific recombinase XerD